MKAVTSNIIKSIIARLELGEDLYLALNQLVQDYDIHSGSFQVIGAVSKARLGIYERENYKYRWTTHEGPMEIASCTGNIAIKEGGPFVHCHAVLAGNDGMMIAGHVAEGCIVDPTAEINLQINADEILRKEDKSTGLWLLDI